MQLDRWRTNGKQRPCAKHRSRPGSVTTPSASVRRLCEPDQVLIGLKSADMGGATLLKMSGCSRASRSGFDAATPVST